VKINELAIASATRQSIRYLVHRGKWFPGICRCWDMDPGHRTLHHSLSVNNYYGLRTCQHAHQLRQLWLNFLLI